MLAFSLFVLALVVSVSQPILARRQSHCPECREPIFVDDLIVEHEGEWMHEECAEDAEAHEPELHNTTTPTPGGNRA
jgi:hypothetical protein